ncbi:BnaA10g13140D [Brassica napus]|uniref:BnaA10g13140D protein n=1 Tax=Brassica napus TaxID=3708 RepID=A0A078H254_BRANA|nr:BnaA10g13140D [Brassica napus]
MGGFFSVPLSGDQVPKDVSHLSCFKASYINSLEENLAAMQRDMEELKARQTDVLRRVEREEETKSMQRLAEVNVWLKNVNNVSRQVSYLLSNRTTELQRLYSKKSRSNYGYGKRVSLMLKKVNDLNSNGVFEVVAEPATETSTKEKRLSRSRPDIVGRETILKSALSLLVSGETGSIGLYGVGGVGKSTILREISNKITARFEFVIWVVVSQHLPIKKIQEEIGRKLGFHGEEWNQKEESQKANDIHNFMKDRRFALLLDDVWMKVDLTKVGVPSPTRENKSKIAFTTRSREMKVGGHASCSKIQETAREVAGRCHGIPLALNVLGETMSCKKKSLQKRKMKFSRFSSIAMTNRERWVVEAGVGLRDMVPVQDWTGVRKMSLMNNEIEEISGGHECHQLTTLFLQQNSNLVRISVVLNMSFTELEELPEQISRLFALRYLNLSRTKIERLPDGLGKLKRLEHLNLETTKRLKSIYGLSNASSLGVLALLDSNVSLDASTIEELQRFERLERLNIDISSSSALKQLLSAPELAYWIEEVCIRDLQSDEACLVFPTTMMQLRKLIIKRCGVLEIDIGRASDDTFLIHPKLGSLSSVTITGCNGLKDLTWLLFVSKLTYLKLQCLDKVEEIISETGEQNAGGTKTPFEKLKRLELSNLPMLKSIYRNPLLFPCLKKIDVERCPKLRKLPLSSGSCLGGDELVISYSDDQWIERVQWEDKATEERFLLCCEKVLNFP